ncbi:hypothetical protein M3D48_03060 [Dermabacter vaginalis]|uniref:hypothetical protein n=1 Tax=Dermabacter vaginalis TaxID=1630135 RepID=UPI0021A76AD6|nr:hypothetical protein [Dermabacter vaginalis]MCT2149605.1 hypothetical protein [Dermabacter vaginalis]
MTTTHITSDQRERLEAAWNKLIEDGRAPKDINGERLREVTRIRAQVARAFAKQKQREALSLDETPAMPDTTPKAFADAAAPIWEAAWKALWPIVQAEYADRLDALEEIAEQARKDADEADEQRKVDAEAREAAEAERDRAVAERDEAMKDRDKAETKAAKALQETSETRERELKAVGAHEALEARYDALEEAHERELERLKQAYESKK